MNTCYHCGDCFCVKNHSACAEALSDLIRDLDTKQDLVDK